MRFNAEILRLQSQQYEINSECYIYFVECLNSHYTELVLQLSQ